MLIDLIPKITLATYQTLLMLIVSGTLAGLLGIPLGVFLHLVMRGGIKENGSIYKVLLILVNILRSIPFIILLIAIIPFTRLIVGTSIGTAAAIVPLTVAAIPFMGRLIENALNELPVGLIETGRAMGASPWQMVRYILLPEIAPAIARALTVTYITLVAYSAMAGAVGGGGLGDLAIRYGYERFQIDVMLITIVLLLILVQLMQSIGDHVANAMTKA